MRQQGRIVEWNDSRGFGFITALGEDDRVFVHVSEFPKELRRPEPLDLVTFELDHDERGRPRARRVVFLAPTAARPQPSASGSGKVDAATRLLLVALAALVALSALLIGADALVVLAVYLVMSLLTYLAYGMDKSAAQRGAFRTQESALHLMALVGGWPGALIAQQQFHHKTRKQPFRTIFWATVVLNVVLFGLGLAMAAMS